MPARPALVIVALGLALVGCGTATSAADSSATVAIKAGDRTCEVAKTSFAAPGTIAFEVQNVGKDVTEVYVYGKGSGGTFNKIAGEVENIAPGTSRAFEVKVSGGDYEVACKPGQKGSGTRTALHVTGASTTGTSAAAYDREVEFSARDDSFLGLTGLTAKAGERIEFSMKNTSSNHPHEFEVFGPDGKVVGEIGPTGPGTTGEAILELTTAGTYTYMCGISDHASRGLRGSFTVR